MVVVHTGDLLQITLQAVLPLFKEDIALREGGDVDFSTALPYPGGHRTDVFNPLEQLLFVKHLLFRFPLLFPQQTQQLFLVPAFIQLVDLPDAQSQTSVIADVQQLHDLIKGVHPITVFAVDLRVDQSFLLIKAHCVDAQSQHLRHL